MAKRRVNIPGDGIVGNGGNIRAAATLWGLTCVILRRYQPTTRAERTCARTAVLSLTSSMVTTLSTL